MSEYLSKDGLEYLLSKINEKYSYDIVTNNKNGLMSVLDKAKIDNTNFTYGYCETDPNLSEKSIVTENKQWCLSNGSFIAVKFSSPFENINGITLNVNATGAKSFIASGINSFDPEHIYVFVYDGTQYNLVFNGSNSESITGSFAYFEEDGTEYLPEALPIDADSLGGYPASSYSTTEQIEAQYVKASIEEVVMGENGEVKPQSPLMLGENGILPLTSYDQIIMPDGSRWNGKALSDTNNPDETPTTSYTIFNRISFTVLASGWVQSETGRFTQTITINDVTSHSTCYHIDVDMSAVTEDTIDDIKGAWALVDNAETVDGGIMLTCFTKAPTVDFAVIADIQEIVTDIPNANGVSF